MRHSLFSRIFALLLALATLCSLASAEVLAPPPFVSSINHYVIPLDALAYLTQEEIDGYHYLMDAIFARRESVRLLSNYDANLNVLSLAANNPYHFLVRSARFNKEHTALLLSYAYSEEEQREMVDFIDNEYLDMFDEILELDMTDVEKVMAVHNYFVSRIEYDYDYANELNLSDEQFAYPEIELYEALKTGKGVCHSYTYLCEFALQQLGIDCLRLTAEIGDTEEGHMWLAVRLDGDWYHIDPTWDRDDTNVSLFYFGMTDEERINSGIQDTWNVGVDLTFGQIVARNERFQCLRDVRDCRMLGGHKMEVWRTNQEHSEVIDLRKL